MEKPFRESKLANTLAWILLALISLFIFYWLISCKQQDKPVNKKLYKIYVSYVNGDSDTLYYKLPDDANIFTTTSQGSYRLVYSTESLSPNYYQLKAGVVNFKVIHKK